MRVKNHMVAIMLFWISPSISSLSLKAGLDRDSSDSSGPVTWVIGVAVAVPVLLLLVIITTTVIIGALVYHFKHPAVPQDSHIPPEKA